MMSATVGHPSATNSPKGSRGQRRSTWRGLFEHQLIVSTVAIAGLLTVLGLLVLGLDLAVLHGETRTVLLEVAVSLILFGATTLLVSIVVNTSLERKMEASIKELLEEQKKELAKLHDTIEKLLESEKDEVIQLSQATQDAVRETQADLKPLGGNWRKLGLTNVYLTRSDALADFGNHIRDELHRARDAGSTGEDSFGHDGRVNPESVDAKREKPRLWIAASSMKGLLESASINFDGLGIFTWAAELARNDKLDLRIIMTHPRMAELRAGQEDRGKSAISEEIQEAVHHLMRQEVPPKYVRMVEATPTVFAIATRDQMLLNPYPYSQEAYRSFTLTVRRSHTTPADHPSIERDIYEQYKRRHFDRPWDSARPLEEGYEIPKLEDDPAREPSTPRDDLLVDPAAADGERAHVQDEGLAGQEVYLAGNPG